MLRKSLLALLVVSLVLVACSSSEVDTSQAVGEWLDPACADGASCAGRRIQVEGVVYRQDGKRLYDDELGPLIGQPVFDGKLDDGTEIRSIIDNDSGIGIRVAPENNFKLYTAEPDAADESNSTAPLEAPPDLAPAPFQVQPAVAAAGGTVEINYPEPTPRGGYYYLHQWTAQGWSEPTHLIETDSNGSPRIYTAGVDDFEVNDYGVGRSPERAPLPEVPAGFWMLCETNNPDTWCVSIEITQ